MNKPINTYDIDGVIFMGFDKDGVHPGPNDLIITGRSYEEMLETIDMLNKKRINNVVYFNPLPYNKKTRESSGLHKAETINKLLAKGEQINIHFEDDPVQANIIMKLCPSITVVILVHDLVEKENVRHIRGQDE